MKVIQEAKNTTTKMQFQKFISIKTMAKLVSETQIIIVSITIWLLEI